MNLNKRFLFINKDLFSIDVDTGLHSILNENVTDNIKTRTTVVPEPLRLIPFVTDGDVLGIGRYWKKRRTV
jgi:hypothetical protein